MSFGHKHYVPILKTKAGERWALTTIKTGTRKSVTPLLELHPHKDKAIAIHAADICEALVSAWGVDSEFFLDTRYVHNGSAKPVSDVFNQTRKLGLKAVPVVSSDMSAGELGAIKNAAAKDGRGVLVRAARGDFSTSTAFTSKIDPLLGKLGVVRSDTHLMLDYRSTSMSLNLHTGNVTDIGDWLSFSAASGSFPRSVNDLAPDTWDTIERSDWQTWNDGLASGLPRMPAFSDYLIKDTGAPAGGGSPLVNLRYTAKTEWLVQRDGKFKDGMAYKMLGICGELMKRPEWCKANFSAGDMAISDCKGSVIGPGNPQSWLQWGMNHHIEYVVKQIKSI